MECIFCGEQGNCKLQWFDCKYCDKTTTRLMFETAEKHPDWRYLGSGRHRDVWKLPSGNVIKIPANEPGEHANVREANIFRAYINNKLDLNWQPARCKLIPNTFILVMVFVEDWMNIPSLKRDDLPDWCADIDCMQVGVTNTGDFVVYDYAD